LKNKVKLLSFFIAYFFAFGITSLDFENLGLENNIREYSVIILGLVASIAYFIIRKREKT
tara:strand:+ start:27535 stop:27714 length:180 start_codon:yes stop_codon:yes gene_type:complete